MLVNSEIGISVIRKSIADVFVLVVVLTISVTEDYITMTT